MTFSIMNTGFDRGSGVEKASGEGVEIGSIDGCATLFIVHLLYNVRRFSEKHAHRVNGRNRSGSAPLHADLEPSLTDANRARMDPTVHAFTRLAILSGFGNVPSLIWFHKVVDPTGYTPSPDLPL